MLSFYLLFIFIISFFLCALIASKVIRVEYSNNRNDKVDGLRGFLAFMVALFHYGATYNIEVHGSWSPYDAVILKNLGSFSVSIFFLISGYLFYSAIESKSVKWSGFYISRALRIYPLFLIVIIALVVVSYFQGDSSNFNNLYRYFLFRWGSLFGYEQTYLINAGVQWTLLYEALFYASLPILWSINNKKMTAWLLVSLLAIYTGFILISRGDIDSNMFLLFAAGFVCRCLAKYKGKCTSNSLIFIVSSVGVTISLFFSSQYSYVQMISVTLVFCCVLISPGNLKALTNRLSLLMSEVSYGIYMIHGVVFFIIFRAGFIETKEMSPWLYFSLFPLIMLLVTYLASLSFIYIESPSMKAAKTISYKLREHEQKNI